MVIRVLMLMLISGGVFAMACSDDDDGSEEEVVPEAGQTGQSLQVTAIDFAFDPDEFSARGGESTEVIVVNEGDADHTFTIDELGIDEAVAPGDQVVVTFDAPQSDVEYYCQLHSEMTGTLVIDPTDEPNTENSPTADTTEDASDGATPDASGGPSPDETDDDDDDDDEDNSGSGSDDSGSGGYYSGY